MNNVSYFLHEITIFEDMKCRGCLFSKRYDCFVRVHIRRTDKLAAEASFHSVAEYMTYVEDYFSALELRNPGVQRRVFLASDDPTALPEAKKKYLIS